MTAAGNRMETLEAEMVLRTFMRLTTAAIIVVATLLWVIPFLLALALPFIAR